MGDAFARTSIFTIRQHKSATGQIYLALTGRLDAHSAELLACWTDLACRPGLPGVTLDLTGLTFADRAGAESLATACARLESCCPGVDIRGLRPRIQRVLDALELIPGDLAAAR